jgi:hypothetical protein
MEIKNPNYGFYGIFGHHPDPDAVWALASEAIGKATGCSAECIKTFLESCKGRLFAQAVIESMSTKNATKNALETAIDEAVARWMDLKITPKDESKYGIQAGLPY